MITFPNKYYDEVSGMFFNYYEEDGQVWYNYYCMTSKLNNDENFTTDFWNNTLNENEKKTFIEEFEDFRHNKYTKEVQYINTSGLFKLLDIHERNSKQIRKIVVSFEVEKGYINKEDDNNHALQVSLGLLGQCLDANDGDYYKLRQVASSVYNAPTIKQIENGNPMKEEVINKFRDDIYAYDDIEEVEYKITIDDEREKRVAMYKKFKKAHPNSSLPEWIVDVIN